MTDKKRADLLAKMVVVIDTREQKYKHITDYLDSIGVKWIRKKLDSGDYTAYIEGFDSEMNQSIIIERKNSWGEITGNFSSGRQRFVREFERIPENVTTHLLIENGTFKRAVNGSYRSQMPPKSLLASLFSFSAKYDIKVWTPNPTESGVVIYNILYYGLRNELKNLE